MSDNTYDPLDYRARRTQSIRIGLSQLVGHATALERSARNDEPVDTDLAILAKGIQRRLEEMSGDLKEDLEDLDAAQPVKVKHG